MASTNFKLFDENKVNILSDQEYNINNQRLNGVQTGIASSQLNNKFSYQVSLVAYAIAQMMVANGLNANDSDAVTTFVNNLSSSVLQKVVDKASQSDAQIGTNDAKWMSPSLVSYYFNYIKASQSEAQAGIIDNKWMSPAKVHDSINSRKSNSSLAQAGVDDTTWMSPLQVKNAFNTFWSSTTVDVSKIPVIPVNKGGTNKTSWNANGLLFADSSSSISQISVPSEDSIICQNANSVPYTMKNLFKVKKIVENNFDMNVVDSTFADMAIIPTGTNMSGVYAIIYSYSILFTNLKASSSQGLIVIPASRSTNQQLDYLRFDNNSTYTYNYNKNFILMNSDAITDIRNVNTVYSFSTTKYEELLSFRLNTSGNTVADINISLWGQYIASAHVKGKISVYGLYF